MKRMLPILTIVILMLGGCKPAEDTRLSVGTEDGGGSGYGTSASSVLQLSDFYGVAQSSTRDNNLLILGTPMYSLGQSDTYTLTDGSQIVLTYNDRGTLIDTLYTEFETGKSYSLFDKLVLIGVLQGQSHSESGSGSTDELTTPSTDTSGPTVSNVPAFSSKTYNRADFDGKLSLYLDRNTVLSTFGYPNSFKGRTYKYDSYIVDCYNLSDGTQLLLDYGYDRTSLRCAAIISGGMTKTYLGSWAAQSKPADFVRTRISLNSVTTLSKGTAPQKVYESLGEPQWFEGKASDYKEVYMLTDGSYIYLIFDSAHTALTGAYQLKADGTRLEVTLK